MPVLSSAHTSYVPIMHLPVCRGIRSIRPTVWPTLVKSVSEVTWTAKREPGFQCEYIYLSSRVDQDVRNALISIPCTVSYRSYIFILFHVLEFFFYFGKRLLNSCVRNRSCSLILDRKCIRKYKAFLW